MTRATTGAGREGEKPWLPVTAIVSSRIAKELDDLDHTDNSCEQHHLHEEFEDALQDPFTVSSFLRLVGLHEAGDNTEHDESDRDDPKPAGKDERRHIRKNPETASNDCHELHSIVKLRGIERGLGWLSRFFW